MPVYYFLLLILLTIGSITYGEPPKPAVERSTPREYGDPKYDPKDWKLTILLPRDRFKVGESIMATARLTNISDSRKEFSNFTVFSDYHVHLFLGNDEISLTAAGAKAEQALNTWKIIRCRTGPGESAEADLPLTMWFEITKRGRYRIEASRIVSWLRQVNRNVIPDEEVTRVHASAVTFEVE